jgi:hypothetical protein
MYSVFRVIGEGWKQLISTISTKGVEKLCLTSFAAAGFFHLVPNAEQRSVCDQIPRLMPNSLRNACDLAKGRRDYECD